MNNKPTLYGLMQALKSAQILHLAALRQGEAEGITTAKEHLRTARENLRVFSYRQKGHITPKGTVLRA
jgi:hypothetical protein